MAPYIPVPLVCQFEFRYTYLAQNMENVINVRQPLAWTVAEATTFAQSLISWWSTNMAPQHAIGCFLREMYVTDLSSQSGFSASVAPGTAVQGTASGEALPPQSALCITFRTAKRGRSYRGRWYTCAMTENQQAGGRVTAGYITAINTAMTALGSLLTTNALEQVIVSRRQNKVDLPFGIVTPVTSRVIRDDIVDTMRRRAIGVGG